MTKKAFKNLKWEGTAMLDDVKMVKSTPHKHNLGIKSYFIVPETTKNKSNQTTDKAVKLERDNIVRYLKANRKEFFEKGKKYNINILTSVGWRGSQRGAFELGKVNLDHVIFDEVIEYGDAELCGNVYAVHIVEL